MDVFQVNTELVTAAHSQAVNLVQSEPKLAVQIAEASFVIIPSSEEIYRAISSFLKHCPSSTGCFVITEDFKLTQTIRIDFVHSTDLVTRVENVGTVLVNCKLYNTVNVNLVILKNELEKLRNWKLYMNKGDTILKKLWCCVGGEDYKSMTFYQVG